MPADIRVRINKADAKRVQRLLGRLPDNLQRKVLTQTVDRVAKDVVLPAVKDRIPIRTFEPPILNALRGIGPPHKSHTGPPGILKRKMRKRPIRRSRVRVGRTITTPTREQLGIPEWSLGYYPAFLEYGKSGIANVAPQPYLRGTLTRESTEIQREFIKIAKARMKYLKERGR